LARAEASGLSLPQLIEQYKNYAHSINDLLWLNDPQRIHQRIEEIAREIYESIIRSKQFSEKEAMDLCREIANTVIELDKEALQDFKNEQEERNIQSFLSQLSGEVKEVETDPSTGLLSYVHYKTNAEAISDKLKGIDDRLEAIFKGESNYLVLSKIMRENLKEISSIANEWDQLRKYVAYLSEEVKELDQKVAKVLGV